MNLIKLLFIVVFIPFLGFGQVPPNPKHYICYHIDQNLKIDGDINDSLWQLAKWSEDFIDIQGPNHTQPRYKTNVKMLWDDSMLYVAAQMEEPHIWANVKEDESIMYVDNDFEIFIDPDDDNHNYFEFEFNALSKKWDLFLARPYRDIVKPDLEWNCHGLKYFTKIYGSINDPKGDLDSAWTMEIAIPLDCIQADVQDGYIWRVNFSRVEWETSINGNEYVKLKKPEDNWVWSPQWAVDMHRPEYWGYLQFSDKRPGNDSVNVLTDKDWGIKMQLMEAYYFQKSYYNQQGEFLEDLPSDLSDPNLTLNVKSKSFIISYEKNGEVWSVNELGRLWEVKQKQIPRFWIWMHPHLEYSKLKWDSLFNQLDDLGIKGILMGDNLEVLRLIIPIANKYNIQVHAWMWTLNRGNVPNNYLSVNALGQSLADEKAYVDYYKFLCPAIPEVQSIIEDRIARLERIDGLSGIHLDYVRYVDVFLPVGLLPKYNLSQDDILPQFDYGYHPKMLEGFKLKYGMSPLEIQDYPHDSLWQQFRMDHVSRIVNGLSQQFSSKEMKLSAAVFPDPQMSRHMVRQDWGNWDLDYYFPMVYNGFYNKGVEWIEERMQVSRRILPNAKIICGLYLSDSKSEEMLSESIMAAFTGEASGIAFFDFNALSEFHNEAIKKAANKYGVWIIGK